MVQSYEREPLLAIESIGRRLWFDIQKRIFIPWQDLGYLCSLVDLPIIFGKLVYEQLDDS
jgi:hypothetical protein